MFYGGNTEHSFTISPSINPMNPAGPERLSEAALSQETAGCPQTLEAVVVTSTTVFSEPSPVACGSIRNPEEQKILEDLFAVVNIIYSHNYVDNHDIICIYIYIYL